MEVFFGRGECGQEPGPVGLSIPSYLLLIGKTRASALIEIIEDLGKRKFWLYCYYIFLVRLVGFQTVLLQILYKLLYF